jgi:hypothetical protein
VETETQRDRKTENTTTEKERLIDKRDTAKQRQRGRETAKHKKSGDGDMKNHSNRETRETDSLRDLKSAAIDKSHRDR